MPFSLHHSTANTKASPAHAISTAKCQTPSWPPTRQSCLQHCQRGAGAAVPCSAAQVLHARSASIVTEAVKPVLPYSATVGVTKHVQPVRLRRPPPRRLCDKLLEHGMVERVVGLGVDMR